MEDHQRDGADESHLVGLADRLGGRKFCHKPRRGTCLEKPGCLDGTRLQQVPGVRDVTQGAPRRFLVVADDAGAATPRVLQELGAAGVEVTSSSEYRPSFDEVFAALVSKFGAPGADPEDDGEGTDLERNSRVASRAA